MSQGIGIYTHLYSLAVQAGFYGDAVECLTATREIRVRSPSGSGTKIFFFTCHILGAQTNLFKQGEIVTG